MMYKFSTKSVKRLKGVHGDLIRVLLLALQESEIDFGIAEGKRSLAKQKKYVREGKSQTLNSRHLTGHAVDIYAWADGASSWTKRDLRKVWNAIQSASNLLGVDVKWGGNWRNFVDAPHFELSRAKYPGQGELL